ncbi:MAG: peptide chain release factor N(5)-glutamine methyltransferase [Prevotellaceae bacterium]|jgi:release factor glutamine methyltransferase|nr:peptide chain release factor N(5)-glutamine methyltransferase [Prevotellaceae bacterium]
MKDFKQYIYKQLAGIYPEGEIRQLFFILMEKVTGLSQAKILAESDVVLNEKQNENLREIVARLKNSEPIQHIVGETQFCGLPFSVSGDVLIPRPETEELVAWILNETPADAPVSILDIGTGSGCIAVSLAKRLSNAAITALDVSPEALNIAQQNAERNNVQLNLIEHDILHSSSLVPHTSFDVIVSNPPYICECEKAGMERNVLNYEPSLALFVPDNDPLVFYRAIVRFAKKKLHAGGKLFFEINRAYGTEAINLLQSFGFADIELRRDFFGNDRMLRAVKR